MDLSNDALTVYILCFISVYIYTVRALFLHAWNKVGCENQPILHTYLYWRKYVLYLFL